MCGLNEGATHQIQGKNARKLKKNRKSFGGLKIMRTFAAVFKTRPLRHAPDGCKVLPL